jgi:hypothetical protein
MHAALELRILARAGPARLCKLKVQGLGGGGGGVGVMRAIALHWKQCTIYNA